MASTDETTGDLEALILRQALVSLAETPEVAWPFIRKVYSILTVQLIITFGVAAAVAFVPSIFTFFSNPWAGWGFYFLLVFIALIVHCVLNAVKKKFPLNLFLLLIYTLCLGLVVGLVTTFIKGIIVVETGIATIVVTVSLLLYTFWASGKHKKFASPVAFLVSIVMNVVSFTLLEIFFPTGHVTDGIYGGIFVFFFSVFAISDTDSLVIAHEYEEYIAASIKLYLDVINVPARVVAFVIACFGITVLDLGVAANIAAA